MGDSTELSGITAMVSKILEEELSKTGINPDFVGARVYDLRTVGVQGDERTYSYLAEVELRAFGKIWWDLEFMEKISNRITNEIKGVNRVRYTIAVRGID